VIEFLCLSGIHILHCAHKSANNIMQLQHVYKGVQSESNPGAVEFRRLKAVRHARIYRQANRSVMPVR